VQARVSRETSNARRAPSIETTVRQAPCTQIESPSAIPLRSSAPASTVSRTPASSGVTAVMFPTA
jgi:hypothetical protein